MTLQKRLTLYTTLSFGVILFIVYSITLGAFYQSNLKLLKNQAQSVALLSAYNYLEEDELPPSEHALIEQAFTKAITLPHVGVYNLDNTLSYGSLENDKNITEQLLQNIREGKTSDFLNSTYFYHGIFYKDNQGDFVIIVKISTLEFIGAIENLTLILISTFILGCISLFFLSRRLSKLAYKPVHQIIRQIKKTDFQSPYKDILPVQDDQYLNELVQTYNELLSRLSNAMVIQKNFINYASHEFKTPLAAISGNLEVFAQKERTPQQYHDVVQKVLTNVYQMEDILTNLLLLSGLNKDHIDKQSNSIDDLIWQIHESLGEKAIQMKTQLNVHIQVLQQRDLTLQANTSLLRIALYNIIENAVKYSNQKPVDIYLKTLQGRLHVIIQDHGQGISPQDMPHVKQTFYRAANVTHIKGSGIGLALASIIFDQHHIDFTIDSIENKGTTVTLVF